MPSVINSEKPIIPEASSVCRSPYTCRAPARHSSAARPTIVRRAPFYDFAVSNHETRSEQSLKLLRAFIGIELTFRKARMAQSMHQPGTFVVLVPLQFRHAKPTKIPAHIIADSSIGRWRGMKPFGSPTLSDQALMPWPSLKLGPGQSSRSHSADEYICISEIEQAISTYLSLLS